MTIILKDNYVEHEVIAFVGPGRAIQRQMHPQTRFFRNNLVGELMCTISS
jgi:hypothetical protein